LRTRTAPFPPTPTIILKSGEGSAADLRFARRSPANLPRLPGLRCSTRAGPPLTSKPWGWFSLFIFPSKYKFFLSIPTSSPALLMSRFAPPFCQPPNDSAFFTCAAPASAAELDHAARTPFSCPRGHFCFFQVFSRFTCLFFPLQWLRPYSTSIPRLSGPRPVFFFVGLPALCPVSSSRALLPFSPTPRVLFP